MGAGRYKHGQPSWANLSAPDPDAALDFYQRLFGWDHREGPTLNGTRYVLTLDGQSVAGIDRTPRQSPAEWTDFFAVDDVEAVTERVKSAGGSVVVPPTAVADAGRIAVFTDSMGAEFATGQAGYTLLNSGPIGDHWLGTDSLGRDILSRMMFGARISLLSSVCAIGLTLLIAVPLGIWLGYAGGFVDHAVMRVTEAMQCIPPLVLALAILGLLEPSVRHIVFALAIIFAPGFIRLIRGEVLAVREATYLEASRSVGASSMFIVRRRVFHNVASPLIVQASIALGYALLAEAGLSFLGLGVQSPEASWGKMLNEAYASVFVAPRQIFVPGCAIALTVLAFNMIGDGLRDVLGVETVSVAKRPL